MLKNILKLDGAQQLSKNEQKEIKGSRRKIIIEFCSDKPDRTQCGSLSSDICCAGVCMNEFSSSTPDYCKL